MSEIRKERSIRMNSLLQRITLLLENCFKLLGSTHHIKAKHKGKTWRLANIKYMCIRRRVRPLLKQVRTTTKQKNKL